MHRLFNPCKIFLSHKHIQRKAEYSTVLLKDWLSKIKYYHVFLDKHEDDMGEFPAKIEEEILSSDVFILKLPDNGNVDFLFDDSSWVRKEIKLALAQRLLHTNYKIIPVSFNKNFTWDSYTELGDDIKKIKDFDICYIDSDEQEAQLKIFKRIGFSLKNAINANLVRGAIAFLLLILTFVGYSVCSSIVKKNKIAKITEIQKIIAEEYSRFRNYNIGVENDTIIMSLYSSIDSSFVIYNELSAPPKQMSNDFLTRRSTINFHENLSWFFKNNVNNQFKDYMENLDAPVDNPDFDGKVSDLWMILVEFEQVSEKFRKRLEGAVGGVKKAAEAKDSKSAYESAYAIYYDLVFWEHFKSLFLYEVNGFEFIVDAQKHNFTQRKLE